MTADSHSTEPSAKGKKAEAPSAQELQEELAKQRAALADTVDQLTAQLDPRRNISNLKAQLADTAANASEEAQDLLSRLRSGEKQAVKVAGITATAVLAVIGVALIRRSR